MKIAIIHNTHAFAGKLTNFFTGSYAYHAAFVDEAKGYMYDMNLLRRRRPWPAYGNDVQIDLYDCPEVTAEYLEWQLTHDNDTYGIWDYVLFALRPLYHLVGKSTKNAQGKICSEMVNDDLRNCGVQTPFKPTDEPPSPADLERWLKTTGR